MIIRKQIHTWLVNHPKQNPYRLSKAGFYKILTSSRRVLPNFLIIGSARCGTTSLYDYLIHEPSVLAASKKEINFFAGYYNSGLNWYRAHFPTKQEMRSVSEKIQLKTITGEATPDYIMHPFAPQRIFECLPNIKIIAMLRNPIDRAFSHHNMFKSVGFEKLTFEDAIEQEEQKIDGEMEKLLENEHYFSYNLTNCSYLYRGIYVDQLKNWYKLFHKDQILILRTEDLSINPMKQCEKICDFLDIPFSERTIGKISGVKSKGVMRPETRQMLVDYFKPHNERLYKFLGRSFEWDE